MTPVRTAPCASSRPERWLRKSSTSLQTSSGPGTGDHGTTTYPRAGRPCPAACIRYPHDLLGCVVLRFGCAVPGSADPGCSAEHRNGSATLLQRPERTSFRNFGALAVVAAGQGVVRMLPMSQKSVTNRQLLAAFPLNSAGRGPLHQGPYNASEVAFSRAHKAASSSCHSAAMRRTVNGIK